MFDFLRVWFSPKALTKNSNQEDIHNSIEEANYIGEEMTFSYEIISSLEHGMVYAELRVDNENGKPFIDKSLFIHRVFEGKVLSNLDEFYRDIYKYLNMTDKQLEGFVVKEIKEKLTKDNQCKENEDSIKKLLIKLNKKGTVTIK